MCVCVSLKVAAQQFYSHGDGGHPASGDDSDEAGENRRVDVVLHVVAVICVPQKSLDLGGVKKDIVMGRKAWSV